MIPTWGELWERIRMLCYGWYRQERKAWRRWRVSRRIAKRPVVQEWNTGSPIFITASAAVQSTDCYTTGSSYGITAGSISQLAGYQNSLGSTDNLSGLTNSGIARQVQAEMYRNAAFDHATNQWMLQQGDRRINLEDVPGVLAKQTKGLFDA